MTGRCDDQEACKCFVRALEILEGQKIINPVNTGIRLMDPEDYTSYINAAYKLADMSRDGKYLNKNFFQYVYIIRQLYSMMRHDFRDYKMPEIEIRMADIALENTGTHIYKYLDIEKPASNYEQLLIPVDLSYCDQAALAHLLDARGRMETRLTNNHFFGNFTVMKKIESKIHSLIKF